MRIIFILCMLFAVGLSAQRNQTGQPPGGRGNDGPPALERPALPDTLKMSYFHIKEIGKTYDFKDSTLNNFFHHVDPAKQRPMDYLTLGNPGSAAVNSYFQAQPYIGFSSGFDQYNLYQFDLDNFRFYEANIPMADAAFSPLSGQQNFIVKSDFAKSFSDGFAASLNYRRILQEGFFTNQATKTTNFGISFRFKSKNKRYTAFATMISNANDEEHNGGVSDTTTFQNTFAGNRLNIPVFTSNAASRYQQKWYSLVQYYQLNAPLKNKLKVLLRYDLEADFQYYKFTDDDVSSNSDQLFYGDFITEDRGIRQYTRWNRFRNAIYGYLTNEGSLNARIGVVYDRISIDQELGQNSGFDNLVLDYQGDIPITKALVLKTTAQMGLLSAAGDFNAKGSLNLKIANWLAFDGGVGFFRYTPSLIQRQLVLNGKTFWDNELAKPVGTTLFGTVSIPKWNLSATLQQNLITNAVYWDQDSRPVNAKDIFSATTLQISNHLRFRKLGFENHVLLQGFSSNLYRLPPISSKHNLYFETRLFRKVLLARFGTEVRLAPAYDGLAYNPIVGQFHQTSFQNPFYPQTDFYFSGKISKFRLFVRVENLNSYWSDDINYEIWRQPQFESKIRFGVNWLLLN